MTLAARLAAAALVLVAIALSRVTRLGRARWIVQAIALTLSVVLVWVSIPRARPPAAATTTDAAAPEDTSARLAMLDDSLRALKDGAREMPRDTWDPDYVVTMVGRDPQRLFRWVQQNTYWIPYHGVLRGPVGVLMDREGNSLDRAILLAVLLQKTGYTVRMAHGELSLEQARDLLPKLEASRVAAFASVSASARHHAVGTLNARVQQQQQAFAHIASELRARVTDQTDRLLKVVQHHDGSEGWARTLGAATSALRDHWWVQLQNGSDWVDLDPMTGAPGAAAIAPRETVFIQDLPATLHHTVTIRVVAEQWRAGVLTEHKILEQVLRPSDLYGHSVALQFFPGEWFEHDGISSRHTRAGALAQDEWFAMLSVDNTLLNAGALVSNGDDPGAGVEGGEMGALAGALAAGMGRDDKKARHLSAVWIDYEIRVPGETPRTVRRTVFDLLGPSARATGSANFTLDESRRLTRSLALTMNTEILPMAGGLSAEFVAALVSRNLVANRDLFEFLMKGSLPVGTPDLEHLFNHSQPLVSTLYGVALARMELSNKGQVFIDRPNIVTRHRYAAPAGDAIDLLEAVDIVANEVGVGVSVEDHFAARLAQGVLDTNAESLWQPDPRVSAGDAFDRFPSWALVRSEADAVANLHLPEPVRRQIASDVSAGYAVVAPAKSIPVGQDEFAGWWRIDPVTGSALGMGPNGWGQPLAERGAKETQTARIAPIWKARIATFVVAFAANYGWCVTPLVIKHVERNGVFGVMPTFSPEAGQWGVRKLDHTLGIWEGAIKPSVGECVGDSIFIAGLTAWLLPVGVVAGVSKAATRGPKAPHVPDVDIPAGGSNPAGGGPGKGGGKPRGTNPPESTNPPGTPRGEPPPEPKPPKKDPCPDSAGGGADEQGPPTDPYPNTINQLQSNLEAAKAAEAQAASEWMNAMQDVLAQRVNKPNIAAQWNPANGPNIGDPSKFNQAAYDNAINAMNQARQNSMEKQAARFAAEDALAAGFKQLGEMNGSRGARPGAPQGGDAAGQCGGSTGPAQQVNPPAPQPRPVTSLDPSLRGGDGRVTSLDPSLYRAPQSGNTMPGIGPSPAQPAPAGPATGTSPAPPPQSWDGKACPWCSTAAPVYPDSSPSDPKSQSSPSSSAQQTTTGLAGTVGALGGR